MYKSYWPLYRKYGSRKPIGIYSIANMLGLYVYEPVGDEKDDADFVTAFVSDRPHSFRKNRVMYDEKGEGYIRRNDSRYYLSEIMRV